MTIINFLDKNNILWFPLDIKIEKKENGDWKKEPQPNKIYNNGFIPKTDDFQNLTIEEIKKRQKYVDNFDYIAIDTRFIYHIDVDFKNEKIKDYSKESKNLVKSYSEYPYFKSTTKKFGKHIFFKTEKKVENQKPKSIYNDIEFLCGLWSWCPKNQNIFNEDLEIPTINETDFLDICKKKDIFDKVKKTSKADKNKKTKKEYCKTTETIEKPKETELFKYMDLIGLEYLDDYDEWIKIVWSLKNHSIENYDLAKYISSKSQKFEISSFNTLWKNGKNGNTIGTAYHYAKISNPEEFDKLRIESAINKKNYFNTDDNLAETFLKKNELNYVFKNEILYTFLEERKRWFIDKNYNRLKYSIGKDLGKLFNSYLEDLEKINMEDKTEEEQGIFKLYCLSIKNLIKSVMNVTKQNSIATRIIHLLSVRNFEDIEFDNIPNYLPFNNKTFYLDKGIWVDTKREDYILKTTGYDWIEPKKEELEEMNKIIDSIFPDKNIKKVYTHYLASSLYGIPIEKFIIANGSGGNGKGLINELAVECLGKEFAYTASNTILLNPLKQGSNPEIANMVDKRLIIYREPDDKKEICGGTMKELTGGNKINARMNYSNDCETLLVGTNILECNKKPLISGRLDDSISRRILDIPFESTFTNKKEDLEREELNNVFEGNTFYKTQKFKDKFKFSLLQYLFNYIIENEDITENLISCERIEERNKKYIEESDKILEWIKETYEETNDKNNFISLKDIFNLYKVSSYYTNLSKKDKRNQNYKYLVEYIQTNNNFRKYYKERKVINGKNCKNILLFWKEKEDLNQEFLDY